MSLSTRQKRDQYCELGFPKGTIQGDGSACLPADKGNEWPSQKWTQPPGLARSLPTALGPLLPFSTQGSVRASNQPVVNMDAGLLEGCRLGCNNL